MFNRSYLVLLLSAALGVGTAIASGNTDEPQKEKEKPSQPAKAPQSPQPARTPEAPVIAETFPLSIQVGGGSYLGVYLEDVTSERAQSLKLKEERGAIVMKVVEGSPAEKAGLRENDVITSFNNRPVESVRELQRLLGETPEGRSVPIEVFRDGSRQKLTATLSQRTLRGLAPLDTERVYRDTERAQRQMREQLERMQRERADLGTFDMTAPRGLGAFRGGRLGVSIETMGDQLAEYFGVKDGKGVLVTEVRENTPAAKAGLKAGDVITAVDGQKTDDINALLRAINQKQEGQMTLTIVRNRAEQTVTVTIEKRQSRTALPRRAFATA